MVEKTEEQKEKKRQKAREWRLRNPDKVAGYYKKLKEIPGKIKEKNDARKEYSARCYKELKENNPEKISAIRERNNSYYKNLKETNPEKYEARLERRRVRYKESREKVKPCMEVKPKPIKEPKVKKSKEVKLKLWKLSYEREKNREAALKALGLD